jgi:hypothetical protein
MSDYYIAKNVMTEEEVAYIYDYLINVCPWRINSPYMRQDNHDHEYFRHHSYPHMSALGPGGMQDPWLTGYFTATMNSVNIRMKESYGFTLPTHRIQSINFNAQRKSDYSKLHTDGNGFQWSVIGFLTPEWDDSWGGELRIQENVVKYKPGDFIAFKSNILHDAMPVLVDTPFWRVTVACFMDSK